MAGKKSARQTMDEWLAKQQAMVADPQFQDDVMTNGKALAGMAKENIGRSADMAMNAGNKLGTAMEDLQVEGPTDFYARAPGMVTMMDQALAADPKAQGINQAMLNGISGAGTALRQGIYDLRTGGQPAAPYPDANSMVDSMNGTIGANTELPNMMRGHGEQFRTNLNNANAKEQQMQTAQRNQAAAMQEQQEMQAIAIKLQEAGIPVTTETVQKVMEQKKMMGGFLQEKAGQGMDMMRGLLQ